MHFLTCGKKWENFISYAELFDMLVNESEDILDVVRMILLKKIIQMQNDVYGYPETVKRKEKLGTLFFLGDKHFNKTGNFQYLKFYQRYHKQSI